MTMIRVCLVTLLHEASDKSGSSSNFASMNLDDWRKMSRDVETAIRKQIDGNDEL